MILDLDLFEFILIYFDFYSNLFEFILIYFNFYIYFRIIYQINIKFKIISNPILNILYIYIL